ncbi:Ig-like domain-containing protein [Vibrio mediterranei]|uniref:Ig-like domain-containing protein n=1 Tax=Vibrio mediterranei TaxID=689 RepID=UPI0038CF29D1
MFNKSMNHFISLLWVTCVALLLSACDKSSDDLLLPDAPPAVQAPVLTPFTQALTQGNTASVDVSAYVSSNKAWRLTDVQDSSGLISDITLVNSTVTFTASHPGIAQLTWRIEQNGTTYQSVGMVAISAVQSTNTAPTANDIVLSTQSDTPLSIDLASSVSDSDGDTLSVVAFSQVGTRFVQNDFAVTYTPNGYVGTEVALYGVSDGQGGMAVGHISIVVNDAHPVTPNTPPTASDHSLTVAQGSTTLIDITPLVNDADGDTVVLHSLAATSGRATVVSAHTVQYQPGNFSGTDSFMYQVADGNGGLAQAQIHLTVTPLVVPAPLIVTPQVLAMTEGDTVTFDLSSGVSSGLAWQLSSVVDNSGYLQVGNITATSVTLTAVSPGVAQATYSAQTANEQQSAALIVAISAQNNTAPTAQNITQATLSNAPISVDLSSFIADADGDALTITQLLQASNPARFVLSGNTVTYTPGGFVGVDVATYVVEDGQGGYGLGQIIVTVADANPPVPNNPPTATGYSQATDSATPVSVSLSGLNLIGDADNDPLTVTLYGGGGRATLTGSTIHYNPSGFVGVDDVAYVVSDGQGGLAAANIVFTVSAANTAAPTANPLTVSLSLNEVLTQPVRTIDVTPLVSDADNDPLTVTQVFAAVNPVTISPPLSLEYTASAAVSSDSFIYVVSDGHGGFAQGTITVNVVNNAPTANAVVASIDPYDTSTPSLTLDMATHVADADGDALTLTLQGSATSPATLVQSGLELTYTPNGYEGTETLGYRVTDGQKEAFGTITIISASQGAVTANDLTLSAMAMNAPAQTIDVSSVVSNASGRPLHLDQVVGATLGSALVNANSLTFSYTPSNISHGDETLYYIVTDGEGHYAQASITFSLTPPAAPVLTDLQINYNGALTTTLTCTDCDPNRTDYRYSINGIPVGSNLPTYQPVGNEVVYPAQVSVGVTVKNAYCTAQNTGVSGGNACQTVRGITVIALNPTQQVVSGESAFAAIKADGSVVTWGEANFGGDSSAVQSQLTNVQSISTVSTIGRAFAAIKADGSVVTWGEASRGGDSSAVQSQLTNVQTIAATSNAFAAIKADGSVVTWGNASWGGDSSAVQAQLTNVQTIAATPGGAFAALKADRSVVTWGSAGSGGDSSAVQAQLTNVMSIAVGTRNAFAAIKADGSVVTWGEASWGGDSSAVQAQLTNVLSITSSYHSFAALKADGSVVTWGEASQGGDSSAVQAQLTNVQSIAATPGGGAFAAVKADGSVVTWGNASIGGDSSAVQAQLTNVQTIATTSHAFAAIKADGSVVTWGNANFGGDSSAVQAQLTNVQSIVGSDYSFAAIKADGSVVTWGDAVWGGDSSAVQAQLDTGINVLYLNLNY